VRRRLYIRREKTQTQSIVDCVYLICVSWGPFKDARFDALVAALIVLNCVLHGLQAEAAASSLRSGEPEPAQLGVASVVFAALFSMELLVRLGAFGCQFFVGPSWGWNWFDLAVVALQLADEVTSIVQSSDVMPTDAPGFLRMARVIRLLRVVRIVRLVRYIGGLRTLVFSIFTTISSLAWTLVLLALLNYVMSVAFTQMVADLSRDRPEFASEDTPIFVYYGSVIRSSLSMYMAITGGISWQELIRPLLQHNIDTDSVSVMAPVLSVVFCLYVAFALLCMLNVITGVFVEHALNGARRERDLALVLRLRQVVDNMDLRKGRMRWDDFESQLTSQEMSAYLSSLDLDKSDAKGLFDLFDYDQTGAIDAEDFINGCIRIHGQAQSRDLVTLMVEVQRMHSAWANHAAMVEVALSRAGCEMKTPFPRSQSSGPLMPAISSCHLLESP